MDSRASRAVSNSLPNLSASLADAVAASARIAASASSLAMRSCASARARAARWTIVARLGCERDGCRECGIRGTNRACRFGEQRCEALVEPSIHRLGIGFPKKARTMCCLSQAIRAAKYFGQPFDRQRLQMVVHSWLPRLADDHGLVRDSSVQRDRRDWRDYQIHQRDDAAKRQIGSDAAGLVEETDVLVVRL